MKKLFLAMFVAASAFAADPLVVKYSGGGFTMPEYAGGESCALYADRVVVTNQFGNGTPTSVQVAEERKLKIVGNLAEVIEKAKAEKVSEKNNGLCDAPTTTIIANPNKNDAVLLFTSGACGSPRKERVGPYSDKLKSIIGLYCPKTLDHGAND